MKKPINWPRTAIIEVYKRDDPAVLGTPRIVTPEVSPMRQDDTPNPIPYGYCQCGCGEKTSLAKKTNTKLGWRKGEPVRFRQGHRRGAICPNEVLELPDGLVRVSLSNNLSVEIRSEDWAKIKHIHWRPAKGHKTYYACSRQRDRTGVDRSLLMHRLILGVGPGQLVDHIDGNGLNNVRGNLRIATHSQNHMNLEKPRNNSSGFKGVYLYKPTGRWASKFKLDGKVHSLGYYDTPEEAALAYDAAVREAFGEFAALNFPEEGERAA